MKVQVTAYRDSLIVHPLGDPLKKDKGWVPTEEGRTFGCVLLDSKENLEVSQEALALMKKVQVGRDAIGDIDWWLCDNLKYAFSWFGPIYRVIYVPDAVSARNFKPYPEVCTIIPNEVPKEAQAHLDAAKTEDVAWKEPSWVPAKKE